MSKGKRSTKKVSRPTVAQYPITWARYWELRSAGPEITHADEAAIVELKPRRTLISKLVAVAMLWMHADLLRRAQA